MDCSKTKDLLIIPLLGCKERNGLIILETKIILPDGDYLTIAYDTVAQEFTDLGETLAKLAVNGIDLKGTKEEIFNSYLTHYGVRLCEGELRSNEPLSLIQMIIHAHDLS